MDIKYKQETMARVSFLLGYGFNGVEVARMLGLSNTTVKVIKVQLKEVYKIRLPHKTSKKEMI